MSTAAERRDFPCGIIYYFSRPFLFELTKINGRFFRKTRGHAALRLTASFSLRGKSQQFSTRAFTFPQKPKGWQIEYRCAKAWFCLRHYYSKRRQLFKASPWGRMCALCRQPRCGFCAHMSLAILHLQRKIADRSARIHLRKTAPPQAVMRGIVVASSATRPVRRCWETAADRRARSAWRRSRRLAAEWSCRGCPTAAWASERADLHRRLLSRMCRTHRFPS